MGLAENNTEVIIGGEKYIFSNNIGDNKNLFDSFNKLANKSFGISFNRVGGEYEPHVLYMNDEICANVSVNKITFYHNGEKRFYIQLGTVMTDKKYRKRGLSRYLIESIVDEWKDKCDAVYLFANDSVLDFYPKFGFIKKEEYHYKYMNPSSVAKEYQKLDMNDEKNIQLVIDKDKEGNSFSKLYMTGNYAILSFYAMDCMKENVYYIKGYDLVAVVEYEDDKIWCHDILGQTDADIKDVLNIIAQGHKCPVYLGFTPKDNEGMICEEHHEEDTTLFINKCGESIFDDEKLMFPTTSHA
ncbi:GNAT family N-acetyltransferase [Inconstantimicrobium porci]|uniref:GNAT family N-acetyltransferase n=1 Tax=Inconstantimicrobium porci TaxID=2652291 RepID=A0A7X2MWK1_9CLOT|nr:GNAT family N-acetyltransferase [Inconstantimicrobium porci]MSR90411.1 GNAT family N-acetyltransferase [Inconstantimicrobium porci]